MVFFKKKIPVASIIIATIELGLSLFWQEDVIVLKFISTDLRKGPLRTAREHTVDLHSRPRRDRRATLYCSTWL